MSSVNNASDLRGADGKKKGNIAQREAFGVQKADFFYLGVRQSAYCIAMITRFILHVVSLVAYCFVTVLKVAQEPVNLKSFCVTPKAFFRVPCISQFLQWVNQIGNPKHPKHPRSGNLSPTFPHWHPCISSTPCFLRTRVSWSQEELLGSMGSWGSSGDAIKLHANALFLGKGAA